MGGATRAEGGGSRSPSSNGRAPGGFPRRAARGSGSRAGSMCRTIFATSCQSAPSASGVEQAEIGDEVLLVVAGQDAVRWRRIGDGRIKRWRLHRQSSIEIDRYSCPANAIRVQDRDCGTRPPRRTGRCLVQEHDAATAVGFDEQDAGGFQRAAHLIARALVHRELRVRTPGVSAAVSATRAFSASISCFQFSKARAARTCRPVIIHDHLRQTICAHQENDYNSRFRSPQRRKSAWNWHPPGSAASESRGLIRGSSWPAFPRRVSSANAGRSGLWVGGAVGQWIVRTKAPPGAAGRGVETGRLSRRCACWGATR